MYDKPFHHLIISFIKNSNPVSNCYECVQNVIDSHLTPLLLQNEKCIKTLFVYNE